MISQQNLKNLIQRYGRFLGGFSWKVVNMDFIVEEPTNKPSMLTACFYITFKILVFERISQLDGCPIVEGVCETFRFMKR